jgi:hypothetical protein
VLREKASLNLWGCMEFNTTFLIGFGNRLYTYYIIGCHFNISYTMLYILNGPTIWYEHDILYCKFILYMTSYVSYMTYNVVCQHTISYARRTMLCVLLTSQLCRPPLGLSESLTVPILEPQDSFSLLPKGLEEGVLHVQWWHIPP